MSNLKERARRAVLLKQEANKHYTISPSKMYTFNRLDQFCVTLLNKCKGTTTYPISLHITNEEMFDTYSKYFATISPLDLRNKKTKWLVNSIMSNARRYLNIYATRRFSSKEADMVWFVIIDEDGLKLIRKRLLDRHPTILKEEVDNKSTFNKVDNSPLPKEEVDNG